MRRSVPVLVFVWAAAVSIGGQTSQTPPPAPALTVWNGVYSAEQAERGQKLYARACADCHGETLLGAESAPPLAGAEFLAGWTNETVGTLFELVQSTMPDDAPNSMSANEYTDVVAYMLKENEFPASKTALPSDMKALGAILIAPKPK